MATHSVNVVVKARDEASRKFGMIGTAAVVMGRAFKSVANIARSALAVAFRTIKYAVMGLAAAFTYCTYAAIKQEAAEIELVSALKMAGVYTDALMQKMKMQAAEIQAATVYGDEYVLTLMRIAMSQGVMADKAAEAAKAAIALYEGFGGGRGKPEIFLRYYIDAIRGTGSSLESYVGELRDAKTEQERHIILQRALARGWDVAKSKAESAGGALKQMKNKLGDIAETIGRPFLPAIAESAKAIKKWAEENEAVIAYWAEKTHSYITLIKDMFLDFVDFMREDWRAGMGLVFDSFLKLLKATFESAVILAIAGGKGIWKGVKEGLLGGKESAIRKRTEQLYLERVKTLPAGKVAEGLGPPLHRTDIYWELRREAEKQLLKEKTKTILGESLSAVTDTFKEALKGISKDMPANLREQVNQAWAEHLRRLKELGMPPGRGAAAAAGETGAPAIFSMAADTIKDLVSNISRKLPAMEARFLTFWPGARFDYAQQTAINTKEQLKFSEKQFKAMLKIQDRIERLNRLLLPQHGTELVATAIV